MFNRVYKIKDDESIASLTCGMSALSTKQQEGVIRRIFGTSGEFIQACTECGEDRNTILAFAEQLEESGLKMETVQDVVRSMRAGEKTKENVVRNRTRSQCKEY